MFLELSRNELIPLVLVLGSCRPPQEVMQAHAAGPASRELGDLGPGV